MPNKAKLELPVESADGKMKYKAHISHQRETISPSPKQTDHKPSIDQSTEMLSILQRLTGLQQLSTLPKLEIDYFDGSDELVFPIFIKNFETLVCRCSD